MKHALDLYTVRLSLTSPRAGGTGSQLFSYSLVNGILELGPASSLVSLRRILVQWFELKAGDRTYKWHSVLMSQERSEKLFLVPTDLTANLV